MTTAWAHLPNAAHIDRVLASLAATPELWDAAWDAAWGAAWDAAWDDARDDARGAARGAIAALVAGDDCAVFLDMPPDAVRLVAASGHHPAFLLLPAAIVFNPSI
jgi:hypothetical protein